MPRSHWLDPLARRVLQATGQLPAPPKPALPQPEPIAPEPPAWVMDVNRASRDQWLQLPGCSQDTADLLALLGWPEQRLANLMRERRRDGFKDLADLQERLCLPASSVEALIGRVSFGSRRAGPSLPLP